MVLCAMLEHRIGTKRVYSYTADSKRTYARIQLKFETVEAKDGDVLNAIYVSFQPETNFKSR